LSIKNLIGNGEDGLFYTSHESINIEFIAQNITLENLYQLNQFDSSLLIIENNNYVNIKNIKILNSGGFNTNVLNQLDNSEVEITNLEIDNYYSNTVKELINYSSKKEREYEIPIQTIKNFKITNILSQGALFKNVNGVIKLDNGELKNIHVCNKYNNCTNISSNDQMIGKAEFILTSGKKPSIFSNNIKINNMYGDTGVIIYVTKFNFTESSLTNSHFKNGFIYLDEDHKASGQFGITNSKFINNTSESGTIFSIISLNIETGSSVKVNDCEFTNNISSNYGGVMYSVSPYVNNHMKFTNCQFNNNHARFGDIIYSYSIDSMPMLINNTYLNEYDVATLPTFFKIDRDSSDKISILSGENIPENISYQLFDDYGKQIFFPKKTSNLQFNELVFFKVEINDPSNAKIIGQTQDYCWDDRCTFPSVKVIGNPGIYILSLKIKSFGQYYKFIQDSIDLEIEIRECNTSTHLNQINSNTKLKSCYIPICEPPCSHGNCTNTNYCDCTGTNFKGQYCNEYVKLERIYLLDVFFIIIACIIILIIVVLI